MESRTAWLIVVVIGCIGMGCACQKEPEKSADSVVDETSRRNSMPRGDVPPLEPVHLMRGLVMPHYGRLDDTLEVERSLSDEEWSILRTSATLLHEASFMLMRERVVDASWEYAASRMLRDGSQSILSGIKSEGFQRD